jgi:hypothetical protein
MALTYAYGHRLTASYLINGWDIGVYGEVNDKNEIVLWTIKNLIKV